ncbi:Splicing factor 3A subunit 1 [Nymphon striatum]|nr:Splicing factor 3A subunit 1 [Nymphon striatum]
MPVIAETVSNPSEGDVVNNSKEALTDKPTIGIIYPPPEVRNIVDKTASFVARNGPEFEARIRQNEINNPKFNFLNPGDPYNGYYHHKVQEFKDGKTAPEPPAPTPVQKIQPIQKQSEIFKSIESIIIPKEPPPEFEFIADPPSISAFDLDVVKLTAQFVARNGRQFLTNLMNREQRNYQFDFLRPQHSLFNYFTKLLEQYTKVLIPPKDLMNKLRKESIDSKSILGQVKYRVEWTKHQEAQKRREEEEAEKERVSYAQIDWHDFVVVETVDYQPNEHGDFPPPTTPEEVGTRVLIMERFAQDVEMDVESGDEDEKEPKTKKSAKDDNQIRDMEEDSDSDDDTRKRSSSPISLRTPIMAAPEVPPGPPLPENVVVRKDYDPKALKPQRIRTDNYLVSPITGDRIPADKVQEHMRIGLLDPRWVEQRDKALNEKIKQDEVFAPGLAIGSSLKNLAERRTDIFGVGDEETGIGKKIGEEDVRKEEKVTWDGHTASMEAATRAARANISIEDQIHQIHKVKGLLPDEEKEKIGPSKPTDGIGKSMSMLQMGKPMGSMTGPPQMPNMTPPNMMPTMPPPMPPQGMLSQPGVMMVPRPPTGPPMRPPPMLSMPPRPPGLPPMGNPFQPSPVPPPMQPPLPPPESDEPPAKKQKSEDSLIPESEFLLKNKSPVSFRVQVPVVSDKPEWRLNGQILTMTLPLTDMVSVIKAKIHDETGMPSGKQKLQYAGIFIKDSNSLAFYNFAPGPLVQLQVKERGGRKK